MDDFGTPIFKKTPPHLLAEHLHSIDRPRWVHKPKPVAATSFSEVGEQKPSQFIGFFYSNSAFSLQLVWRGSRTSQTFPYEFVTNQAWTVHFMASPPYVDETPPHWPHCIPHLLLPHRYRQAQRMRGICLWSLNSDVFVLVVLASKFCWWLDDLGKTWKRRHSLHKRWRWRLFCCVIFRREMAQKKNCGSLDPCHFRKHPGLQMKKKNVSPHGWVETKITNIHSTY